ncbi:solute:sodium symporter family transporter [Haemophilus paracuniculus]|uniref:Solute:sodium symporter family transporter n=1 Tax=Haemophilus paracuniculus TaxID=734 RepID=A0A1T0AVJ9_9PAST|nr:solute:sodium symporter family transporter [Haemophilus paracuniculus]OOS00313.1 solute:sodium symporter family transporter [Haemophilus paracuniculus]
MFLTIISFLIVTGLVAGISWYKTRNDDLTTSKGYFLAGRGLSAVVIGCSMVLTSLSTEQLIGVNANSYTGNFSIIAWTVQSVIPLCFLALYLLPKYIRNGYTTIPEFFENRFDRQTRLIMSTLFLVFYLFIVIPTALYTGAIAFNKVFNLETIFGLSYGQAIVYTVVAIGIVGAIYAIFGGLKAVAVSDTWNAIILVIGALLVPIFALSYLGYGSISAGLKIITTTHVEKFNAIGSATDAVPWPAMFTGILIVNFFYWTTNQAIVQRALGARDLKAGQKGILIAALFLLLLPIILNLPGLLSFHILGEGQKMDGTYPQLVNKVLPTALQGFFVAALFGAVLSTFNSFLNSAATIFCKDLLPSISKKQRSDSELILLAKKVSAIMAVVTIIIAPLLMYGTEGIFLLTKRFAGFVNIPIVALFAVGLFNKTVSGLAARIALLVHVILYFCIVWVFQVKWNFVYVMASLFVFDVVLMLVLGQFLKRATPYQESTVNHSDVDLSHWEYAKVTVISLVLGLITLYAVLSPLGLASPEGNATLILGIYAVLQVATIILFGRPKKG